MEKRLKEGKDEWDDPFLIDEEFNPYYEKWKKLQPPPVEAASSASMVPPIDATIEDFPGRPDWVFIDNQIQPKPQIRASGTFYEDDEGMQQFKSTPMTIAYRLLKDNIEENPTDPIAMVMEMLHQQQQKQRGQHYKPRAHPVVPPFISDEEPDEEPNADPAR